MNWLIDRFGSNPDRNAFIQEGREVTYWDVVQTIEGYTAHISSVGIKTGDLVVIVGDYSPEVFCLMLALSRVGAILIPLSRHSVIEESAALNISGCDWYITFDQNGVDFDVSKRNVEVENELLKTFRERRTPGLVLFSSGSTGKPKGILHDFTVVAEKFRKQGKPIIAIPFLMIDHFGGINTILAITANLGTVVSVSDRSVASICKAIARYKVELLPTTPSFLTLLLASGLHREFDLSSLKKITYGTEVMPQTTLDRLHKEFPAVALQQTYGLSEVGVLRSQSRDDGSTWVRIGGEGFQTKIIDNVLWIKSDYAMVGYLNAPSNFDSEGWFNTQDQVEVDGDYFRIIGRVTDLINVGGQKVYPAEIESAILKAENILDVAVFGEANKMFGHIIVAKVILKTPEPVESVKKRVRQVCLEQLAPYKAPTKILLAEGDLHSVRQKKVRQE